MSVESGARSGRPSTSRNEEVIEKVCQIAMEVRRPTLREIVEELRITRGSVHSILTEGFTSLSWCCEKKATRHVDREELAASPRQCSRSFRPCNQRFFGPKTLRHLCDSLLTLLIWHHATSHPIEWNPEADLRNEFLLWSNKAIKKLLLINILNPHPHIVQFISHFPPESGKCRAALFWHRNRERDITQKFSVASTESVISRKIFLPLQR